MPVMWSRGPRISSSILMLVLAPTATLILSGVVTVNIVLPTALERLFASSTASKVPAPLLRHSSATPLLVIAVPPLSSTALPSTTPYSSETILSAPAVIDITLSSCSLRPLLSFLGISVTASDTPVTTDAIWSLTPIFKVLAAVSPSESVSVTANGRASSALSLPAVLGSSSALVNVTVYVMLRLVGCVGAVVWAGTGSSTT